MSLNNEDKPTAYRVDDNSNLEEKDLKRSFLFGKGEEERSGNEPDMEAEGTGGERFGEQNNTPAGDDRNNPSQNAGYSNGYFSRTEPSDEHPEDTNFKDPNQSGQPNYTQGNEAGKIGQSDTENTGQAEGGGQTYQEGTVDGNDDANIPGPNELPDQQKVGE